MVDVSGQAGATTDRNKFCDPDGFLDYDPMPLELALRASFAAQGYVVGCRSKHAADELNTIATDLKLFGDI